MTRSIEQILEAETSDISFPTERENQISFAQLLWAIGFEANYNLCLGGAERGGITAWCVMRDYGLGIGRQAFVCLFQNHNRVWEQP